MLCTMLTVLTSCVARPGSRQAPVCREYVYRRPARRFRRYHRRQRERKQRWAWGWSRRGKTERGSARGAALSDSASTAEFTYIPHGSPLINGPKNQVPHLDPYLPGFKNWDPLRLSENPTSDKTLTLEWLSYAELIHGRWAMLGAVGCLTPDVFGRLGIFPHKITGLSWFAAAGMKFPDELQGSLGAIPFQNLTDVSYWADAGTLCWSMFVLMGIAETRRIQDYKNPGSMGEQYFLGLEQALGGSGDPKYPGGQFFNMLGLGGESTQKMDELKTKEVTHGRLAMVAMLGISMQAAVTKAGPVQNLIDVYKGYNPILTFAEFLEQNLDAFWYLAAFVGLSVLAVKLWVQDNYPAALEAEMLELAPDVVVDNDSADEGADAGGNGTISASIGTPTAVVVSAEVEKSDEESADDVAADIASTPTVVEVEVVEESDDESADVAGADNIVY